MQTYFVWDIICIFACRNTLNMANRDLNRLKVVLAERTDQTVAGSATWKRPNYHIKMVYQFKSTRLGKSDDDSKCVKCRNDRLGSVR